MKNMNIKMIAIALLTLGLTGCGEKDAQYYYDNPKELKTAGEACEAKIKAAQSDAELDKLATDKVCKEAKLAIAGVRSGDLKKAILAEDRVGWGAHIKKAKKNLAKRKAQEAKEKENKIKADKLREKASKQSWKDYLNDESHMMISNSDCFGRTKGALCIALKELWEQKAKEGKDELVALPYNELTSKEKEYCENPMSGGSFGSIINACSVWKDAEKTRYQVEFDAYVKGDEAKIRQDYNSCREEVKKAKPYTTEWMEAQNQYPCKIVSRAVLRRFDSLSLTNFAGELPK